MPRPCAVVASEPLSVAGVGTSIELDPMNAQDKAQLELLLAKFIMEKGDELAESIKRTSTIELAAKRYEHGHPQLDKAMFILRWVKASQITP
jgi:hypothetical protein